MRELSYCAPGYPLLARGERARRRALDEERKHRDRQIRQRRLARRQRVDRGRQTLTSIIPRAPRWRPGILARRRRRRLAVFAAVIAAVCLVSWPLVPDWGSRILILVGLVFVAPLAWVLVN
jgi:Flp pilus assembly protein TadB